MEEHIDVPLTTSQRARRSALSNDYIIYMNESIYKH